jgi:integrase/recombinase XerD
MSNTEWIARFLSYLRSEQGLSDNTVLNYEIDLRKFSVWLDKPFASAHRIEIQRYLSDLMNTGLNPKTAGRRLACFRHFYRFLIDEGEIAVNPTRNLPLPKTWKTIPKALGLADLDTMVASLGDSWLEIRDRAMLLTFFASGLRATELSFLKLPDIDLEAGAAKVWQGKGAKDGIVPLSPPAISALKQYLEQVRPQLANDRSLSFVFLGRHGPPLTRQQVFNRIRSIAQAALGKRVSPHFLRHGFATALVEGGADIRDVQVLMRHTSVDTTAIYIHTDLSYLRRIYYATHPRARIAPPTN